MFDFVSKKRWYFLLSALVIIPGIISLLVSGLNLGLDFKSGTTMTLVFREQVAEEGLRAIFVALGYSEASIQRSDSAEHTFLLQGLDPEEEERLLDELQASFQTTVMKAEFASEGERTLALIFGIRVDKEDLSLRLANLGVSEVSLSEPTALNSFLIRVGEPEKQGSENETAIIPERERIKQALEKDLSALDFLDFDSVSEEVAGERVRATGYAVIAAAVAMLLYITWAFRKLFHPFRYGICAIIALIHDALVVLGIFSLFRLEVDSTFILAVLTVIGYSINDTIVVFDRIRENRARHIDSDFVPIVNLSLSQTLARSLNTSLTTLFALLAIYLFGGATISNFALALIIGIIAGTYSSIFIASQLVVAWEQGELRWLSRWIPLRRLAALVRR